MKSIFRFAITMADSSRIENRLRGILDRRQNRRTPPPSLRLAALGLGLAPLVLIAALRPGVADGVVGVGGQTPAEDAGRSAHEAACFANVKRIATAFQIYAQDYDATLPPMDSSGAVKNRLRPYVAPMIRSERGEPKDPQYDLHYWFRLADNVFVCPETGTDYTPVAAQGERRMVGMDRPAETMILHDAVPHAAHWNVAFADGHVATSPSLPPVVVAQKTAESAGILAAEVLQLADQQDRLKTLEKSLRVRRMAVEDARKSLSLQATNRDLQRDLEKRESALREQATILRTQADAVAAEQRALMAKRKQFLAASSSSSSSGAPMEDIAALESLLAEQKARSGDAARIRALERAIRAARERVGN